MVGAVKYSVVALVHSLAVAEQVGGLRWEAVDSLEIVVGLLRFAEIDHLVDL